MSIFGRRSRTSQEIHNSAEAGAYWYWKHDDQYVESEEQDPESVAIERAQRMGMHDPEEIAEYAATFGVRVRAYEREYDSSFTTKETPKR